jgi:hypothetical protein
MLALFSLTQVTRAIGTTASAANDPRGNAGFGAGADSMCYDAELIDREIKSHVEAIALYEDEATSSDIQLSTFAQRILPQLHRHLDRLRSMKTGN